MIFLKVVITFFIEHNFLWKYDINSRIQPSGKLKKSKVSRCSYREHCIASVSAVVSYIFLWGELWQSLPPLQRLVPACQPPEKNRWEMHSIKAILCYFNKQYCMRMKKQRKMSPEKEVEVQTWGWAVCPGESPQRLESQRKAENDGPSRERQHRWISLLNRQGPGGHKYMQIHLYVWGFYTYIKMTYNQAYVK